jgi:hypothetical protein
MDWRGFVKLYPVIGIIAVLAVPVAVQSAEAPARKAEDSTRVVCEVTHPPGSRLGGVRRCRTQAEWAQYRAETRDVVHRIQAEGATFCDPNPNGGPHC